MQFKPTFNFTWCVAYLETQGRKRYGSKFTIPEASHEVIYKLLSYCLRSKPDADQLGLDLSKGIALTGPIGCGKTCLMTLLTDIPGPLPNYILRPCRNITFDFHQDGYTVLDRYSTLSYRGQTPKTYCFDDLGAEQALKHYGNDCNVMAEILLSRYDHFISAGMLTHLTTNLSASEIDTMYGPRVRSRMREMFNLISFDDLHKDQRQ